jgi:hypothetical protein
MKTRTMLFVALCAIAVNVSAQTPNNVVNKDKIGALSAWLGRWQGEGSMQMGPGEPKKSSVDERIESKLDGTIMVVEGIGKTSNPEMVVHHAFGIISYDAATSQYKFKTYLKDGRSSDAWFSVVGDNKYQWGFDVPNGGKVRYSITLDPNQKTWNEIGEFSRDGNTYAKFFEMNLKKVE